MRVRALRARAAAGPSGRTLGATIQRTSTILLAIHIFGAGLLFCYNVAVARLLGPERYGVFVYVENIAELLLPVAVLGLPNVVVRYASIYRTEQHWPRLRGLLLAARTATLAAAVLLGAAAWVGYEWLWPGPVETGTWLLPVGLTILPVLAVLHVDQAVLQGLRAPIVGMLPNQIVRPLLALGATAALWWLAKLDVTTALMAFAGSLLVTEVITVIAAHRQTRRVGSPPATAVDVEPWRAWFGTGTTLLAGSVMRRLQVRVNILFIGAWASASEVALYAIGFQATRFIGFAIASVGTVSGPYVAAMFHERELTKLQAVFDDAVRWVALIAVPVSAAFLIFGEQLLALFGAGYRGGYPALAALVVSQLVGALTGPTASMLTMAGDQKWLLASLVAGAVVNVVLSVWLVPGHGAFGGALGGLGGVTAANIAMLAVLRRKYDLRLRFRRTAIAL